VQALRDAAAAALVRGAPEAAVRYLRRALAEPPPESVCAAALGELGSAEKIARDPAAVVHLKQAWQATRDPVARARLAEQLADVLFYSLDITGASAVLQAGLEDIGDRDFDLTMRLHAHKAGLERLSVRSPEAHAVLLEQLRELAARGLPSSRSAQLMLANSLALRGQGCHEVAGLVERGWDGGRFLAEEGSEASPVIAGVYAFILTDELEKAQALIEAMLADARARGSVVGFQAAIARRGMIALRRGELAKAEADTRLAFQLATEHNLSLTIPYSAGYLGLTLLERGRLDEASAVVEGVRLDPAILGLHPTATLLLEVRGRVRLARGRRAEAIADLRHCGQLASGIEAHNPNFFGWRAALALALAAEHPPEARELAHQQLELAHRAGVSRAIGIALRVCGLVTGGKDGIELVEQSVCVLDPTPMRLDLAYSLTEWGAALRRAGARAAAREPLRRALDLAARCGAISLVQRVRDEALAAGARPRRPWTSGVHALTPSEFRVAQMAAQAMGNREIAQALFITTKTVRDHLSSAYRKLNISSRDQLATAMK
jgi:DNA-binding CsgD family transcriptional regulator